VLTTAPLWSMAITEVLGEGSVARLVDARA
jgi:hypothetical protein